MSSGIYMIDCPKCNNRMAYEDYDYSDKLKITGCDECNYEKREVIDGSGRVIELISVNK